MALIEMVPVLIVGPRGRLDQALDTIAGEGLQLMPSPPVLGAHEHVFDESSLRIAGIRQRAAGLRALLPRPASTGETVPTVGARWSAWQLPDIEAWLAGLASAIRQRRQDEQELGMEREAITGYAEAVQAMAGILEPLRTVPDIELVLIVVSRARRAAIEALVRAIGDLVGRAPSTFETEISGERMATFLVLSGVNSPRLKSVLAASGLTHMDLPSMPEQGMTELTRTLARQADALADRRAMARRDLDDLARVYGAALEDLAVEARRRLRRLALKRLTRETMFLFVRSAWAPPDRVAPLRDQLAKSPGGVAVIALPSRLVTEPTPTFIRNPAIIAPYEVFLRWFPLAPQLRVDPTPFIALSFPTFVGLMVGDIGYGAVLAALGTVLRRWGRVKGRGAAVAAGRILLHCGISAAAFGAMFGEMFGLSEEIHIAPFLFDRRDTPFAYLCLVMGVGIGHLLTGYLLGLRTALQSRDWRRGARLLGELVSVVAVGLLLALQAGALPASVLGPGLFALAIALVLLVYAAGYAGPLDLPAAFAGFISYVRLFAVGLASASLARAANQIGGLIGSAVLGVIAAILLHVVFLAIGLTSPFVQAARLQLVEFGSRLRQNASLPQPKPRLDEARRNTSSTR